MLWEDSFPFSYVLVNLFTALGIRVPALVLAKYTDSVWVRLWGKGPSCPLSVGCRLDQLLTRAIWQHPIKWKVSAQTLWWIDCKNMAPVLPLLYPHLLQYDLSFFLSRGRFYFPIPWIWVALWPVLAKRMEQKWWCTSSEPRFQEALHTFTHPLGHLPPPWELRKGSQLEQRWVVPCRAIHDQPADLPADLRHISQHSHSQLSWDQASRTGWLAIENTWLCCVLNHM